MKIPSKIIELPGENFFKIPLRDDYPYEIFKENYYEINIKNFIDKITY